MEDAGYEEFTPSSEAQAPPVIDGLRLGQAIAADLIASVEIPECSVAASDTAERAEEVFNYNAPRHGIDSGSDLERQPRHLAELLLTDNEFMPQDSSLKWVSPSMKTASGYSVRLALSLAQGKKADAKHDSGDADTQRLTLLAVTRTNVAFPLARFGRADQVFCDHVQFWGEEDGDELDSTNFYGWGEDDNGSRFDAVQTLSELLKGSSSAPATLIEQLQLETRLENKLGPTTSETEQLIAEIFSKRFENSTHTFSQEFSDQPFGRVTTDITVEGTLAPIKDEPQKRKFTLRAYPSSQADRNWEPREFVVDVRGGITTPDGASQPRELDVQTMLDLLNHASLQRQAEVTPRTEDKKIDSFLDRYLTYNGLSIMLYGTIQSAYNVIAGEDFTLEQYVPRLTTAAVFTGLGGAALSPLFRKVRGSRQNRGGEEEAA